MHARSLVAPLFCAAILFTSSAAVAEQGHVVLVGGQIIAGDIQQVVKDDYIIIKLANGDVKAIPWADVASFAIGGSVIVGGGSTQQQPVPVPVIPAPAPTTMMVYVPPPPPPPPRRPPFEPTLMLGARVGTMYAAGNVYGDYYDYYDHHYSYPPQHGPELHMSDVASWGYMFEGDLGFHFSPCWTVYGFWEHGELDHGDFNVDKWGHTNAAGIGATVNTAPYDRIGAYFDFGASYRWMTFTDVTVDPANPAFTRTTVEGFDFLRTAIGVSIAMSRTFRLDPHLYVSSGYFTRFKGATCPGGCSFDSQNIDLGYHTLSGIAVSGHFDLSL